ncbi:DVL protein [Dillenia turbinata]|uniref:DVL protein n=1 Tax=Dillenia turbinata TaxID=194707 RepID=A0AAN8YV43_9MAGN
MYRSDELRYGDDKSGPCLTLSISTNFQKSKRAILVPIEETADYLKVHIDLNPFKDLILDPYAFKIRHVSQWIDPPKPREFPHNVPREVILEAIVQEVDDDVGLATWEDKVHVGSALTRAAMISGRQVQLDCENVSKLKLREEVARDVYTSYASSAMPQKLRQNAAAERHKKANAKEQTVKMARKLRSVESPKFSVWQRCSRYIQEQRGRLYIIWRCTIILLSWQD